MDERLKTGQAECSAQNQIELKCIQRQRKQVNGADVSGLPACGRAEGILLSSHRSAADRKRRQTMKRRRRWVLLCHKAVNNVLGHIGVLVDLRRQTASHSKKGTFCKNHTFGEGALGEFLTGFTSKANNTCCMSGDTWYLPALDLSWMGSKTNSESQHTRYSRGRESVLTALEVN